MKVLVTGATGLVGSHLVEEILASHPECQVRILARPSSDRSVFAGKPVEVALGDLAEPGTLRAAVEGVGIVFHCAAFVSDWASREEMVKINVEGLRHLLDACVDAGVGRFVEVSSMVVLGADRQDNLDETAPYVLTGDLYNYTKIEAEKMVLDYGKKKGLPVTVIRPPYIYGPRDRQLLPRVLSVLKEKKFVYIDGGNNPFHLVFVRNLVQALLLAAKSPAAVGQTYHITDGVGITRRELVEFIADELGYPKPAKSIPLWLAKAVCGLMEIAGKITKSKKPPLLNRFRLKFMSAYITFNIDKARKELGYHPAAQKICLKETLDWYKTTGKNLL